MSHDFQDRFGRAVTVEGDGPFVGRAGGIAVEAADIEALRFSFDGLAPGGWSEPAPPRAVPPLEFMRRMTDAEKAALISRFPIWAFELAAAQSIDPADPAVSSKMAAAVDAGAITRDRAAQVLDLSRASP
jgi:hypothetical protein